MSKEKLTRRIRLRPGHNCIDFMCKHGSKDCLPGKGGSHGLHGMHVEMGVVGRHGAIVFSFCLIGMIPGRMKDGRFQSNSLDESVVAWDLGFHANHPVYDKTDKPLTDDCEWTGGGKCWYDGSTLNAEPVLGLLAEQGEEPVWEFLEGVYSNRFESGEYPEIPKSKLVPR